MKCKHCIWEFFKGYNTCSYCGKKFNFFSKNNNSLVNKTDVTENKISIETLMKEIDFFKEQNDKLRLENADLKIQLKKLKAKIDEQNMYHISFVDKLDGIEFEEYIKTLLEKLGYENVHTTPASNDYGADVIAEKDGIKYAIQCKNYKDTLGNKCVQEIYSGKEYYKCQVGIVLTNSYFTVNAISQAKNTGIILWDRNKLIELLDKAKKME